MKDLLSLRHLLLIGAFFSASVDAEKLAPAVVDGTRLTNYTQEIRFVFPDATRVEEYTFLPREWGGITLMGLIGRLVGSRAQKPFEGMDTRRYIYRAYKGNEVLGVSHGSSITGPNNNTLDIHAFYNHDGSVRDIRIDNAPPAILAKLSSGGYLKQFIDRPAGDFSVIIGRRGRVRDWGTFSKTAKRPQDKEARKYFNSILRSMRFNSAFVEIAYFIGQTPLGETEESE